MFTIYRWICDNLMVKPFYVIIEIFLCELCYEKIIYQCSTCWPANALYYLRYYFDVGYFKLIAPNYSDNCKRQVAFKSEDICRFPVKAAFGRRMACGVVRPHGHLRADEQAPAWVACTRFVLIASLNISEATTGQITDS